MLNIDDLADRFELVKIKLAVLRSFDNQSSHLAAAKWHYDSTAGLQLLRRLILFNISGG